MGDVLSPRSAHLFLFFQAFIEHCLRGFTVLVRPLVGTLCIVMYQEGISP